MSEDEHSVYVEGVFSPEAVDGDSERQVRMTLADMEAAITTTRGAPVRTEHGVEVGVVSSAKIDEKNRIVGSIRFFPTEDGLASEKLIRDGEYGGFSMGMYHHTEEDEIGAPKIVKKLVTHVSLARTPEFEGETTITGVSKETSLMGIGRVFLALKEHKKRKREEEKQKQNATPPVEQPPQQKNTRMSTEDKAPPTGVPGPAPEAKAPPVPAEDFAAQVKGLQEEVKRLKEENEKNKQKPSTPAPGKPASGVPPVEPFPTFNMGIYIPPLETAKVCDSFRDQLIEQAKKLERAEALMAKRISEGTEVTVKEREVVAALRREFEVASKELWAAQEKILMNEEGMTDSSRAQVKACMEDFRANPPSSESLMSFGRACGIFTASNAGHMATMKAQQAMLDAQIEISKKAEEARIAQEAKLAEIEARAASLSAMIGEQKAKEDAKKTVDSLDPRLGRAQDTPAPVGQPNNTFSSLSGVSTATQNVRYLRQKGQGVSDVIPAWVPEKTPGYNQSLAEDLFERLNDARPNGSQPPAMKKALKVNTLSWPEDPDMPGCFIVPPLK